VRLSGGSTHRLFQRACIVRVRVSHLICFDELKCCLKILNPPWLSRIWFWCRHFYEGNIPHISANSPLMIRMDTEKRLMAYFKKKAADAQKRCGSEQCSDGAQLHYVVFIHRYRRQTCGRHLRASDTNSEKREAHSQTRVDQRYAGRRSPLVSPWIE